MNKLFPFSVMVAAASVLVVFNVSAQHSAGHKTLASQDIEWGPPPPGLPPGGQVAVLIGDPAKEGHYVIRFKAPKGYFVPPHTHPRQEIVTILSGTFSFGSGEKADREKAKPVSAGGIFIVEPGHAHYVYADDEAVLQASGIGPFTISYVNPSDDPRKKQ
jgi:quercetin dioxygenase-like cupin family protein